MPTSSTDPYRPLVVLGVLIATVFILSVASKVLIPIALGVLLSFVLNPAVQLLVQRGMKRLYAVSVVVVITAVLILLLLGGLVLQLRELTRRIDEYKVNISLKLRSPVEQHGPAEPGLFAKLSHAIEEVSRELQGNNRNAVKPTPVTIHPDRWIGLTYLPFLAGPLAGTLGSISLTIGLTVSMLVMREDLRNRFFLLLGDGNLTSTTRALDEVSDRISRYLVVQVSLNSAFGTLFGLLLFLIGVEGALVWAVLAFALRFVPYIGTWLAAVFPLLVSLGAAGWWQVFAVVGVVLALSVLFNNILEPLLVSRTVGVTPIALVVSMAFWTWLWGPIGLVLSTPITVGLSVVGKYVPSLRFFDVMLGRATPIGADLKFYQRLLARDEAEAADLLEQYLQEPDRTPLLTLDEVLMPALIRARKDRERGLLNEIELADLVRRVREILETVLGDPEEVPEAVPAGVEAVPVPEAVPEAVVGPRLLACAGNDELDELAIELLARMIPGGSAAVAVVHPGATAADVLEQVRVVQPAVVCLSLLPPAGAARARYLCKRLQAAFPTLPIIAALWGRIEANDPLPVQLTSAGALHVGTSLPEVRSLIVPLLQVAPHLTEPAAAGAR